MAPWIEAAANVFADQIDACDQAEECEAREQVDPVLSGQEILEPFCDRGSERRLVDRNTEAKEGERCLERYSVTVLDRDG